MIVSVSRRTDIPAFYADWFFTRLAAGHVLVRNPMRYHQVARISLSPDVVDGIVLWTKNPGPMMDRLNLLAPYPYYVQLTLTGYGQDVERHLPDKDRVMIPRFQRLADLIGPERVIWRYDPVFVGKVYSVQRHLETFDAMARRLSGYTDTCVFSFMDAYRSTRRNADSLAAGPLREEDMHRLAEGFAQSARASGMTLSSCAEAINLGQYGIRPSKCVDAARLARIGGIPLRQTKDKNQRAACGCDASIDIGVYNTCRNGCLYCYANYDEGKIPQNSSLHDPASPMLVGCLGPEDTVYDRKVRSDRRAQTSLLQEEA